MHNRRYFNQQANVVLEQTKRSPPPVSIMIADIDSFKRINDTFGHSTGDLVLCEVARIAQDKPIIVYEMNDIDQPQLLCPPSQYFTTLE